MVSKIILLVGLNQFHGANLIFNSDVDQNTFGKVTKHNKHDSQEVSPFPAGDHKMMLHTKYQGSRSCGFKQEDFLKFSFRKSIFSLCDLDIQWTFTIWTIIKEGHIRIIPAKFGQIPASCLGGDVI